MGESYNSETRYDYFLSTGDGENLQISDIELKGIDLRGANLHKAQLVNVKLIDCDFRFSRCFGVEFRNVTLVDTKFDFSIFEGAKLNFKTVPDGTSFWGSHFKGAKISIGNGLSKPVDRNLAVRHPQFSCPAFLSKIDLDAKMHYKKLFNAHECNETAIFETARMLENRYQGSPKKVLNPRDHCHMDSLSLWWTSRNLIPPWALMRN